MNRLNYSHLLYFWTAARYGGLAQASDELLLSRSTLCSQIHQLEGVLGHKLLIRSGRNLVLTDIGQVVFEYANKIFALGRELDDVLGDRSFERPRHVRIGIADVIPRLVVRKFLRPILGLPHKVHIVCREDHSKRLLVELAIQNLDVVIDDSPIGPATRIRGYSHLLSESDVLLFATKSLAAKYRTGFPRSLDGAPVLLPSGFSVLRLEMDKWFERQGIRPHVVGEFDDRDLLEVFGQEGTGIFAAPAIIRREIIRDYNVCVLGPAEGLRESYYAISVKRQIEHPAVTAIIETAIREVIP